MQIKYGLIFIAAFVAFAIGAAWYSPLVFAKQWMALTGMKMEDGKKLGMWKYYVSGLVSYIIMAYVLYWIIGVRIGYLESIGQAVSAVKIGVMTGFLMWFGFVGTVTLGGVLWEKKPFKLYVLNNAYTLIALLVMGAMLGGWR